MPRYFLEVSYKGTHFSGFQSQHNANTIQAEVEKAMNILHQPQPSGSAEEQALILTGSSRTDTGVHALQNYFHFDSAVPVEQWRGIDAGNHFVYKMNAILPADIVIKKLHHVPSEAHCRFDAISREYKYYIYNNKDPFLKDRAFYFPYKLDIDKMKQAAALLKDYTDFTSFSKRNTQVKSFICQVQESEWMMKENCLVYHVRANRFLRGMVRALTATMLKVGRNKLSLADFQAVIESKDCTRASFAVPPHGLFLLKVQYPESYFS